MNAALDWINERGVLCQMLPSIQPHLDYERPIHFFGQVYLRRSSLGAYSYTAGDTTLLDTRVGRYCSIGDRCTIGMTKHPIGRFTLSPITYQNVFEAPGPYHVQDDFPQTDPITINNDVRIGAGVRIPGGVSIGTGAIVGAGSVVTKDIPSYAIVAGSPARIRRMRFPDAMIERLLRSSWWPYDLIPLMTRGLVSNCDDPLRTLPEIEALVETGKVRALPTARYRITALHGSLSFDALGSDVPFGTEADHGAPSDRDS